MTDLPGSAPAEGGSERYALQELLGEGGMGRVYRAYDHLLQREVALKFIRHDDLLEAQRLLLEARIQAGLDHPAVAKVFEVGDWDGRPFIAMQLVRGRPIDEVAQGLDWRGRAGLLAKVAEAVHAAHLKGLVHRDLKPANILVEEDPGGELRPYVMDFGLARGLAQPASRGQVPVGTLAFMPPEQATGERPVDARSDVYSLGATLYALCAGAPPFASGDSAEVAAGSGSGGPPPGELGLFQRVLEKEPPPLRQRAKGIPRDLDTIVHTCLRKDPRHRYPSAQALAEDLRRCLAGHPIQARPVGPLDRLGKLLLRHRALTAVAAGALLLLLAAQGFAARRTWRAGTLAIRLGAEAQELESQLRMAYLQPRHDLRADLAAARARLARLEAEVAGGGSAVQGPGAFALGRAHLALRNYDAARRDLQRAEASGLRGPDLALALGTTLGELYRARRAEAERIPDPGARAKALAEANAAFRDPALAHLAEAAKERGAAAAFAEGLLAYYQEDWDRARAKAREALAHTPGLFEAWRLEGDILLAQGRKRLFSGDMQAGLALFEASREAYAKALDLARSDPALARAEAMRCYVLAYAQLARGMDPAETLGRGLAAVAEAEAMNPDDPQSAFLGANLCLEQADAVGRQGKAPTEALRRAHAYAERGITLGAERSDAWEILAAVCGAEVDGLPWGDPAIPGLVEKGLTATAWAMQLNAASSNAHYIRAALLQLRASLQEAAGQDPRPALEEARDEAQRTLDFGGNRPVALLLQAQVEEVLARREAEAGRDGGPAAQRATELYAQAQRGGPGLALVAGPHAAWLSLWGHLQLDLGRGAEPQIAGLRALQTQLAQEKAPAPLVQWVGEAAALLELRRHPAGARLHALVERLLSEAHPGQDPDRARVALQACALEVRSGARQPALARGMAYLRRLPARQQGAGLPLLRAAVASARTEADRAQARQLLDLLRAGRPGEAEWAYAEARLRGEHPTPPMAPALAAAGYGHAP